MGDTSSSSGPLWLRVLRYNSVSAAISVVCATLVSTPPEVIKTRLQLQGELAAKNSAQELKYKGPIHGGLRILKEEGMRGIYKGLGPGIAYQIVMNGIRLGSHASIKRLYRATDPQNDPWFFYKNVLAGATAGAFGSSISSPFYLVKVRLQSAGSGVGKSTHNYTGTISAMRQIYLEHGVRGLYAGMSGQVLRVSVGSAAQLSTFDQIKHIVSSYSYFESHPNLVPVMAAAVAGIAVAYVMNPVDLVSTRLYNQHRVKDGGAYYSGPIDCLKKSAKAEGVLSLWKGTVANYFRLGPHTMVTFVTWDLLKRKVDEYDGFYEL